MRQLALAMVITAAIARPSKELHAQTIGSAAEVRRLDQAQAPSLPELLLALPQDDEPFERIRWIRTA